MQYPAPISPASLPAPSEWEPLDKKRILRHFLASLRFERVAEYIAMQDDLLPDERIILFFLSSVYEDSYASIRLYNHFIVGFLNFARTSCLRANAQDVDAFIRHYQAKGSRPRTLNTLLAALKSFFRRLVDTGVIDRNPTAFHKKKRAVANKSLPGHLSHSLSADEMSDLFDKLDAFGAPQRDILIMKTLFMTGLRGDELVTLRWKNRVLWQGNWYFDVKGKGSKNRRVFLPDPVVAGLDAFARLHGARPDAPVFGNLRKPQEPIQRPALYKMIKKWSVLLLGRPEVSPHWFRHSCFTHLAAMGAPLESIKAMAGHESIETTMLYNEAAQLMKPAGTLFNTPPAEKRG